ncbi:MAG: DUF971 domain-containing protein [Pseudazoarcus pumilus]|nr:DUF971 domain-containing protein [Pseudazoarcus pumilus]
MAGLDTRTPTPTSITVQRQSRILQISFDDGASFQLPFEYLRVYSPSAEVRGHGPGQEVLQVGKRMVDIVAVDPVGNYAIRPRFDDGHDSGLYSWDYLYDLGARRDELWQAYLDKLAAQGASRDDGAAPRGSSGGSCGSSGCGSGGCGSHGH